MAYDFVVGISNKVKDSPDVIGSIDFNELPAIGCLSKKVDSWFLKQISNLFEDTTFSPEEVEQAMKDLHPLLLDKLVEGERAMLYKLLAMLSYASVKKQSLFGVAD